MPDQITERVKNVGALIGLQERYPVGFAVVITIVAFFIGSWWGRIDSKDEVNRLTTQNEKLQNNQQEILTASLQKNGIIQQQSVENQNLQNRNGDLRQTNDTLSKTIIQVGETLLKAETPAVKILNK